MSLALLAGASLLIAAPGNALAIDGPPPAPEPERTAYVQRANMGGGFIEFLFGDNPQQNYQREQIYQQQPDYGYGGRRALPPMDSQLQYRWQQEEAADPAQRPFDPKYEKQVVDYRGKEGPGTIVVDTPNKFLYLVQGDGKALRYGIGVGRLGFTWSGVKTISAKKEWPHWTPPPEMLVRRPDLPAAHGRRPAKYARRSRDVSGLVALSHPRLQRALDHRHQCLLRLHPDAQRGRHRPLRPRQCRREGNSDLISVAAKTIRRPDRRKQNGRSIRAAVFPFD
jgi:lipoprotein-anchoring transpeptidase ErfK/SrfK